jgi:spermidine synthase
MAFLFLSHEGSGSALRQGSLKAAASVLGLFFVSGLTGLVYQIIWLRQFTLLFGATAYASSAVLSTFMGGLALGSYWAGRRADRWRNSPLRTYGKLELGIAAYALLIPVLLDRLPPILGWAWGLGAERNFALFGLLKFIAIAILVLPATTLMGATLPVLSRVVTNASRSQGGGVGALYAVNTFGAVAGTAACAFYALPAFGMRRTLIANIALNLAVGGLAWWIGGRAEAGSAEPEAPPESSSPERPISRTLILAFAASGFAAMVLEVAWTRGLALVFGSSVYAYACMLAAFLLGLALGAGSAARFLERRKGANPRAVLAVVLAVAGVCSLGAAYAIQELPRVFVEIYFRFKLSPEGWWLAQLGMALLVMFPTTYALGWVFPLVLEAAGGALNRVASSVGRVYAANTLGTIAGAAAGGFLFIPLLGVGTTLVTVAVIQLLLGAALALASAAGTPVMRRTSAMGCIVAACLCVLFRPEWDVMLMNSGPYLYVDDTNPEAGWKGFNDDAHDANTVLYARDGLTTTVVVGYSPTPEYLYLTVNGKTDASSEGDLDTQILLGQIPLLLHPTAKDVLVIGLASGITVGTVATHAIEHVRVVDVEGAMVDAARIFGPYNHNVLDDPRVTVSINDARNELDFNRGEYDVIISEPSNPWMTVASNLFTEEFFRIGKSRLRPGGVFGQWIQYYSLTPENLKSILAGFHRSFPHVMVFALGSSSDLLAVGSDQPLMIDVDALNRRMSSLWIQSELARAGIRDAMDVVSMIRTGEDALTKLVRGAPANTDDNGLVEFAAPKALHVDTQKDNMMMLWGGAEDPVAVLRALSRSADSPDRFRMEIVRRWIRDGHLIPATRALPFFTDLAMKSEADGFLRDAKKQ